MHDLSNIPPRLMVRHEKKSATRAQHGKVVEKVEDAVPFVIRHDSMNKRPCGSGTCNLPVRTFPFQSHTALLRSSNSVTTLELFKYTHRTPPSCKVIISPYRSAHFEVTVPKCTGGNKCATPSNGKPRGPEGYVYLLPALLTTRRSITFERSRIRYLGR